MRPQADVPPALVPMEDAQFLPQEPKMVCHKKRKTSLETVASTVRAGFEKNMKNKRTVVEVAAGSTARASTGCGAGERRNG